MVDNQLSEQASLPAGHYTHCKHEQQADAMQQRRVAWAMIYNWAIALSAVPDGNDCAGNIGPHLLVAEVQHQGATTTASMTERQHCPLIECPLPLDMALPLKLPKPTFNLGHSTWAA